jgi:hypothetical protein
MADNLTRGQLKAFIAARLTDPLNQQITPKVMRTVFARVIDDVFNLADDNELLGSLFWGLLKLSKTDTRTIAEYLSEKYQLKGGGVFWGQWVDKQYNKFDMVLEDGDEYFALDAVPLGTGAPSTAPDLWEPLAFEAETIDLQDVPLDVRNAVIAGTFNAANQLEPKLDPAFADECERGMYFVDLAGTLYVYMFGSDGLPNWCRFPVTPTYVAPPQVVYNGATLYLHDYGQIDLGERGNEGMPFSNWPEVYAAAQDGDTIKVRLPKRPDHSVNYAFPLNIRKVLNIVCERGVEFTGYLDTPTPPSTLAYSRLRVEGATFIGGSMLRRNQFGQASTYFVDCIWQLGNGEIFHRNYGDNDTVFKINKHYFTRCQFYGTNNIFHFEARAFQDLDVPDANRPDYSEGVDMLFLDCHIETTSSTGQVFYGNLSDAYKVTLLGATQIITPGGTVTTSLSKYTSTRGLAKEPAPGLSAIIDKRYTMGANSAGADLSHYMTKEANLSDLTDIQAARATLGVVGQNNYLSNVDNVGVTPGAVLRETVQVYGPQAVSGQKTFQSPVRAVAYDSPDGKMSIGFSDVGVALRSPVLPLTNLYFEGNYQGVNKSFYWRFEGRNGAGFQGDPKGFIVNDLDAGCGEMMLCDTHEQNFSNDYNASISFSPNVALFRKRVKVGIGTDNPTERLEVGGNIKAVMHIFNNAEGEPGTKTDGGILFVQAGALKYKGSNGTVTVIAPA